MDTLSAIRLFIAAADAGSLAAGGRATGRSRDQASKLIAQLEAELDMPLFRRSTRALTLTEAGAEYLEDARRILRDLDVAAVRARGLGEQPQGPLQVNAPMMFGTLWLAPRVPDFLRLYPEIALHVAFDDRLIDLPAPGVDVVLRLAEAPGSNLAVEALGTVGRAVYASPAYLRTHGRPRSPRDIEGHACLHYGYLASGSEWVLRGPEGAVERARVSGPLVSNNGAVLSHAAVAGHGLVILPDFLAEPFTGDGRLLRVLDGWAPPTLTLFALSPPLYGRARKLRAFIDFVAAQFAPWEPGAGIAGR